MTFSEKVLYVRKQLGITQEELARELTVSFATINRWESGNYKPSRLGQKAFNEFCKKKEIIFAT